MPSNKQKKKNLVVAKMLSIRQDQYDRIEVIAEKEDRSKRAVIQRMLDAYEGKEKS